MDTSTNGGDAINHLGECWEHWSNGLKRFGNCTTRLGTKDGTPPTIMYLGGISGRGCIPMYAIMSNPAKYVRNERVDVWRNLCILHGPRLFGIKLGWMLSNYRCR